MKEQLEMAKLQYSDEIATARENAQSELSKIREETAATIATARDKAKTERKKPSRSGIDPQISACRFHLQKLK